MGMKQPGPCKERFDSPGHQDGEAGEVKDHIHQRTKQGVAPSSDSTPIALGASWGEKKGVGLKSVAIWEPNN